jgi:hypothetical protein
MSNEISWRNTGRNNTLYFTVRQSNNQYWNGFSVENLTIANWSNYDVPMTETPTSGYLYLGNFPSSGISTGWHYVDIYQQGSGVIPLIGDTIVASEFGYWDKTNFKLQGGDTVEIGGVNQTGKDLGASIAVGYVNQVTSTSDFYLYSTNLSSSDSTHNNQWLVFTSGANNFVPRLIQTYTGATKRVQFTSTGLKGAFPNTVASGDPFQVMAGG